VTLGNAVIDDLAVVRPGCDATRPSSPKAIEEVSIRYWSNGIDASISRRRGT
jgi:hypothetical protein